MLKVVNVQETHHNRGITIEIIISSEGWSVHERRHSRLLGFGRFKWHIGCIGHVVHACPTTRMPNKIRLKRTRFSSKPHRIAIPSYLKSSWERTAISSMPCPTCLSLISTWIVNAFAGIATNVATRSGKTPEFDCHRISLLSRNGDQGWLENCADMKDMLVPQIVKWPERRAYGAYDTIVTYAFPGPSYHYPA